MNKHLIDYKNSLTQILGIVQKTSPLKPKPKNYFQPKLKISKERIQKIRVLNKASPKKIRSIRSCRGSDHVPFSSFLIIRNKPLTHKKAESQPSSLESCFFDVKPDLPPRACSRTRPKMKKQIVVNLTGW